jgi:hypothetical protein
MGMAACWRTGVTAVQAPVNTVVPTKPAFVATASLSPSPLLPRYSLGLFPPEQTVPTQAHSRGTVRAPNFGHIPHSVSVSSITVCQLLTTVDFLAPCRASTAFQSPTHGGRPRQNPSGLYQPAYQLQGMHLSHVGKEQDGATRAALHLCLSSS